MSIAYLYVNDELAQYFWTGLFNESSDGSSLGAGWGSRVFHLLLLDGGDWANGRCRIVSDISEDYEQTIRESYTDISVEAQLALIRHDGADSFREKVRESTGVFCSFCDYANILQVQEVHRLLDDEYGPGKWQKKLAKFQETTTNIWSERVCRALERSLELHLGS